MYESLVQEPHVESRSEQLYVAIDAKVTMSSIGEVLPPLHPEVRAWAESRNVAIIGPPFFKYNVIDMARELDVEVGFAVANAPATDGRVLVGLIPGGKYAVARHVGHPSGLVQATADLLAWVERKGYVFDVVATPEGERWTARFENYLSDPRIEPDMNRWETELAFRLRDS